MNGRPGKAAFADNFSTCNRFISDKANFTPYSLDALRRDDFSKTLHQRRSPDQRNQLTGLASAALSAFLPQQQQHHQPQGNKPSFLSSVRFGGSGSQLDQQQQQPIQQHSFRHHHHQQHHINNGSRFPFILRHRPSDNFVGLKDEFHQRRRDPPRRQQHFKNRGGAHFSEQRGGFHQRSPPPGQNAAGPMRKRSYRDLDAPDPVQVKLDRRRLVSYADIVCPNEDEPAVPRPRWNRRRRYSSSNERNNIKLVPSVAPPVDQKPEVTEPIEEDKEVKEEEQSDEVPVESPEEEDEFEQNLKAELERVKGNDSSSSNNRKVENQQEERRQLLNADQILKHLTRTAEPPAAAVVPNHHDSPADERGMSADIVSTDGQSAALQEEPPQTADPALISKRLAADHRLVVRPVPFGEYECNRDFRRRLRREYQQVLGCGRMPKPLSNFQAFSVLTELADLHLNDGKPSASGPTGDEDQLNSAVECKNESSSENTSVTAATVSSSATADILGYMKSFLAQTSNPPLSFGMSAVPAPLRLATMPGVMASATGTGLAPQQPVTLPFDFRPCVPPPNYRPQAMPPQQQPAFQQPFSPVTTNVFAGAAQNRFPLLGTFQQPNRQFQSSLDLPRLLRSDQFTNALLQLTAAAAAAEGRQFSAPPPAAAQIANIANSFLAANHHHPVYSRGTSRRQPQLNQMSEVVREAQEFVRSRLATQPTPTVLDLKPIPNVIGPLGNAGFGGVHWPPTRQDFGLVKPEEEGNKN